MRLVKRTNIDGFKHLYYLKDNDPDTATGILANPPDVQALDWQEIIKDIHNGLVDNGLIQISDIQRSNSGLDSIISGAIKRRLVALYRSNEEDGRQL